MNHHPFETTREVQLKQGTIRFRDVGRGPILVFVHGPLVSGSVWRKVVPMLSKRYRCIVPDWPMGSHGVPMEPGADLSPEGMAQLVADFVAALDLHDVTLVGNDSGGAVCQVVLARHRGLVTRLVLTTCDAFEVFPPKLFSYLKWLTWMPSILGLLGRAMLAFPSLRRLPIAYGIVAKHPIDDEVLAEWVRPARDPGIRRDVVKFIRGISPAVTQTAARELAQVDAPVLLVWTPEDRCFPVSLAHRLVDTLRDARLVLVEDSFVFVAEDQPAALARAIEGFVATRPSDRLSV
jgi:pimeloyl-ACP methyl ester carboxylesterase